MAKNSNDNYSRQQNRYSLIIIIFLIVFVALGVAATIMWPRFTNRVSQNAVELVRIPRVTTSLNSADGESRSVTAIFVVETSAASAADLDSDAISANIRSILANGDFDMLVGRESVEYAKNRIREYLPGMMDISAITELYLVDLQAGDPNRFFMDDTPTQQNADLENFLRGVRFR